MLAGKTKTGYEIRPCMYDLIMNLRAYISRNLRREMVNYVFSKTIIISTLGGSYGYT